MAARLVNVDRDTPMLLPPDLREWVPEDDLVHFVLEAVMGMRNLPLKVNRRGTGSAQFPPKTMLALLVYCYANGIFSSRKIERATYMLVTVRYLMANHHPDHETICKFRRENKPAVQQAFVEILKLARAMGVLKVGTVSIDGTHIRASASKDRNVRYDRACELEQELTTEVDKLLEQAEQADRDDDPSADGQRIPPAAEQSGEADPGAEAGPSPEQKRINRLSTLRDRMRAAREHMEEQAKQQAQAQRPAYEAKVAARQEKPRGGSPPKPPRDTPEPEQQANLTDPDSRLMRKNRRSSYEQTYNAQAAVDADGSMLILSAHVSQCASDVNELIPAIEGVSPEVGEVTAVLADTGYAKAQTFKDLQEPGDPEKKALDLYVAVGRDTNHDQRQFDFRPASARGKPSKEPTDPQLLAMREKLATDEGKQQYRKRKQTVEPVFGIIKSVLGFGQFLTRGLQNVAGEWSLIALAYNIKRLAVLQPAQPAA